MSFSISDNEINILKMWEYNKTFEQSIINRELETCYNYSFYDGPPFATGLPHYGHILVGCVKDIIARFKTQQGDLVRRIAGWDTQGLPIEMLINKKLNIECKDDVYKLGIKYYNMECRNSVLGCAEDWKYIIGRTGRWIDFDNAYKTMDKNYMESQWWVFLELYKRGLIYEGFKVSPYSIGCATSLSNSESKENYKNVISSSITIKFKLKQESKKEFKDYSFGHTYLLVWTTTPWTLPSNMALCTRRDMIMVTVLLDYGGDLECNYDYIIMSKNKFEELEKDLNSILYKVDSYEVLDEFNSGDLEGLYYEPLYKDLKYNNNNKIHRIVLDNYVMDNSGTGIVHLSPAHGEDDFRVCLNNNIISKDGSDIVFIIDDEGRMINRYDGKLYSDCNELIIEELKSNNLLFENKVIEHSYPFCWRTDTPLIYRAIKSWFVNVESIVDDILASAKDINWSNPESKVKFNKWIEESCDWCISRTRFWGTPLPIWKNDEGEIIVIGSIDQLYRESGVLVEDLHREYVDEIVIKSKKGLSDLKRVEYVFDCWFDSGSMPYAKLHYPFENEDEFNSSFPADFVCESSDQIRNWFYKLHIISTALFDSCAFKNVIVTGLILAEDGQKMSKSKNNYPDPMDIINKYGSDALRLYFIGSPVISGNPMCFKEDMVMQMAKDIIIPLMSTCAFYEEHAKVYSKLNQHLFVPNIDDVSKKEDNIMDEWIMTITKLFVLNLEDEMIKYDLTNITINIRNFVEQLNNTYIKSNRNRFIEGSDKPIKTLHKVLSLFSMSVASIIPFCSEYIYQKTSKCEHLIYPSTKPKGSFESVHLTDYPKIVYNEESNKSLLHNNNMMKIISVIRRIKDKCKNSTMRYPIKQVIICDDDPYVIESVYRTKDYIMRECNIMEIVVRQCSDYNKITTVIPNERNLGKKFRTDKNKVVKMIKGLDEPTQINELLKGKLILDGYEILKEDVDFKVELDLDESIFKYEMDNSSSIIIVDTRITKKMEDLYILRLFKRQIQKCRKEGDLHVWDKIKILFSETNEEKELERIVLENKDELVGSVKNDVVPIDDTSFKTDLSVVIDCVVVIDREIGLVRIVIVRI